MVTELTTTREAVEMDRAQLERHLLEGDADVDARDDAGTTLLHRAACSGNIEAARLLLEHGADVNATDNSGATPLHGAASTGHTETARLLLEHGANMSAHVEAGQGTEEGIPLDVAASNGHTETAEMLRQTAIEAMKADLRNWGLGLMAVGVISILLAGILDPIWGVLLIALGGATLLVRHRSMFIVIGVALFIAGTINLIVATSFFWIVLGLFQFKWGFQEACKFWGYGMATRSVPIATSTHQAARN